jgi:orotate phosphoribosyltransferase
MLEAEKQLFALLKTRSFKEGEFRLASGDVSDYYIDGRMSAVYSEAAYLIGEVLYEHTKDLNINAIGGLEVGAVPLTTAAVIAYQLHGRKMEGFWVRNEVKDHGTRKLIEGNLQPGARVVIVDDVFTKGTSAMKAAQRVMEHGCQVVRVIALVDRLQGAKDYFRDNGIDCYSSIFSIRDFGINPDVRPGVAAASR